MAKALAGEAGCSFHYKSGSEFDEVYVGVGGKRVKELFQKARKSTPAVIFIDEIDALAPKRDNFGTSSNSTINQLLSEMDGFSTSSGIVVIGATNRPESLDKAVMRPGRFDKTIQVTKPDMRGRKEIFEYYLAKIYRDEESVSSQTLASASVGMTGADIKNLVNTAILKSIRDKRLKANMHDFEHALDRVQLGVGRKNMHISEKDKLHTAVHEGGHTLVNLLTSGTVPFHKVTILPRGPALGFTSMIPDRDQYSQSREELLGMMDVLLGGRVAEELRSGNDSITTGCSSDLNRATSIAYQYVRNFAMEEESNLLSAKREDLSDQYNFIIDT